MLDKAENRAFTVAPCSREVFFELWQWNAALADQHLAAAQIPVMDLLARGAEPTPRTLPLAPVRPLEKVYV